MMPHPPEARTWPAPPCSVARAVGVGGRPEETLEAVAAAAPPLLLLLLLLLLAVLMASDPLLLRTLALREGDRNGASSALLSFGVFGVASGELNATAMAPIHKHTCGFFLCQPRPSLLAYGCDCMHAHLALAVRAKNKASVSSERARLELLPPPPLMGGRPSDLELPRDTNSG